MNQYDRAVQAMQIAAQRASDGALELASPPPGPKPSGERIRQARRVRGLDLALLDAAVVVERLSGASWEAISEALNLPLEETCLRYEPMVADWRKESETGLEALQSVEQGPRNSG